MNHLHPAVCVLLLLSAFARPAPAEDKAVPVAVFQGDFFGEMSRSFASVVATDPMARTMTVLLERDGSRVTVPIRYDTELHFRDSWGELGDYFPGQRVMLFMYVDDAKQWSYPRAVQDDLHVAARHGWFAKVTAIDPIARTYSTTRAEKDAQGKVTKEINGTYTYAADAKVWKGKTPGDIATLALGDEVIQQLVLKDGAKVAVEIVDRAGDQAITAAQDARHRQDEDALGLPAYVTDLDVLTGSLTVTVAWSSAACAKSLKPGEVVAVQPTDGTKLFAAAIRELQAVDTRTRLQVVINARVACRLGVGQTLRLFMPGTGPEMPTGRTGVPEPKAK